MCLGSTEPHDAQPEEHRAGERPSRRSVVRAVGGGTALGMGSLVTGAIGSSASATTRRNPSHRSVPPHGLAVVLLGTAGGPPPRPEQTGISTAVVIDGAVYLVDAGRSSLTQYGLAGLKLADLRTVFLTHLHADHIADYFNYFMLGGWFNPGQGDTMAGPVPIYGPGSAGGLQPPFGGAPVTTVSPSNPTPGLRALTDSAAAAYAYSTNVFMRDSAMRATESLMDVHEIGLPDVGASYTNTAPRMSPFAVFEDDRVKVTAILVPHGPVFPAFAYRFETDHGSVTLSGDTTYTDNIIRIARDTDLLIHEAINLEDFTAPPAVVDHMLTSHVEVQKVGPIAQRAGARRLALSHTGNVNGTVINQRQWRRWAQRGYDGQAHVGMDLDVLTVPRAGRARR